MMQGGSTNSSKISVPGGIDVDQKGDNNNYGNNEPKTASMGLFEPPNNNNTSRNNVHQQNTTKRKTTTAKKPNNNATTFTSLNDDDTDGSNSNNDDVLIRYAKSQKQDNNNNVSKSKSRIRNDQSDTLSSLFQTQRTTNKNNNKKVTHQHDTTYSYNDERTALLLPPAQRQQSPTSSYEKIRDNTSSMSYWFTVIKSTIFDFTRTLKLVLIQPTTYAGACMFVLYHVVFCLANGSAISAQHHTLGIMAKLSTVGITFAGPLYIYRLGDDIPAIYPSIDLFLAPFLANAAVKIYTTMYENNTEIDNDIFLSSFVVLTGFGMLISGLLLLAAAQFRLANLGTFLPYSVLCGFFSAVGVLLWALAFAVDNAGQTWQKVFIYNNNNWHLIQHSLIHHLPSLIVGILMNILGPKNPFYVIYLILLTWMVFYVVMFITNTSLEEAQENGWFWSRDELLIDHQTDSSSNQDVIMSFWEPPVPFCIFKVLLFDKVDWKAVRSGMGDMIALSVLYLLRSSIHASAMKKNVGNLVQRKPIRDLNSFDDEEDNHNNPDEEENKSLGDISFNSNNNNNNNVGILSRMSERFELVSQTLEESKNAIIHTSPARKRRSKEQKQTTPKVEKRKNNSNVGRLSEQVELPAEFLIAPQNNQKNNGKPLSTYTLNEDNNQNRPLYKEIRAKIPKKSLETIFVEYGYALILVAFAGGFGVCPTVATSNTMYAIGAGGAAPQYGSILLLLFFYWTDFQIVRFIPKAAFSSLLVLGAVDTFVVWFFQSFRKTQDVLEWLVVPLIVAFSLIVGFLNAVFVGIAIATFVFVANFFRVGVVKYKSSGIELRSTIERTPAAAEWLDLHGDYIQVLVLQGYLFFGNANSVANYISTMFEEVDDKESKALTFDLPPFPKVIILDLSLSSGMDTSSYDIFAEIQEKLKTNNCKLFFCGVAPRSRAGLGLVGVKPTPGLRSDRHVRFFPDLDSALGKAEDVLTADIESRITRQESAKNRMVKDDKSGFVLALEQIDSQHNIDLAIGLIDLFKYTTSIELESGELLYGDGVEEDQRGLFFIESGLLKIQRDASTATFTRNRSINASTMQTNLLTLNRQHARTGTVGRRSAFLKESHREMKQTNYFRLARIGPGWVVGTIEFSTSLHDPGVQIAVGNCRLHHLPFEAIQQIEEESPVLALKIYKLIQYLMAHRQEATISQLAALKSIMNSYGQMK